MADAIEKRLERWVSAGVVDAGTAARIRTYEESQSSSERLRWPVLGHCDLCAAGVGVCAAKECDVDKCSCGGLGSGDQNIRLQTRRRPLDICVEFTRPLFLGRSWSARDGGMGIAR